MNTIFMEEKCVFEKTLCTLIQTSACSETVVTFMGLMRTALYIFYRSRGLL